MTAGAERSAFDVSVVIPTCSRPAILRETLRALARQRFAADRMEVIVVVDGGDEGSIRTCEEARRASAFPMRALTQPRGGQGRARNAGMRAAEGRVVLMLDDDIIAHRELVAAHLAHHDAGENTIVTGSLPVRPLQPEPAHHRALREWWEEVMRERASPGHRFTFQDFVTGNVSVPRSRLLAAGGFDPDFTGYGREDYELGHRLLAAGMRMVYEPRARGEHLYSKPLREWLRQFEAQGRADVIFSRKHPELRAEIMTLSPFPTIPWIGPVVWGAEQLTALLNGRGGRLWKRAAATAQAAHYWRGVRMEATADELRALVRAQLDELRARRGRTGLSRVALARVGGWI